MSLQERQGTRGGRGHRCLLSGELCLTERSDMVFLDAVIAAFANSASEDLTALSFTTSKMGSTVPMPDNSEIKNGQPGPPITMKYYCYYL